MRYSQRKDPAKWFRALDRSGWRIIYLRRRNLLHQSTSMVRSEKTQFAYRASDAPKFEPTKVDPAELAA